MINVKLKTRENIDVQLQPKQGIKIDSSNKYLFDPTLIQGYVDLTKDYSDRAMQSEANAKASEMNAELSAEQAKSSEDNAKLSETRAKESELKAKTSENNAKESETNAKTSETNARNSEVKATQEANASAESAYQSQQSALASAEYASNAQSDSENASETLTHVLESEEKTREYSETAKENSEIAVAKANESKQSEINAKASENKAIQEANASAESAYQAQQSALASAEYASNAESDAQNVNETLGLVLEAETRVTQLEQSVKGYSDNASAKSEIATEKAEIATTKASEVLASANRAEQSAKNSSDSASLSLEYSTSAGKSASSASLSASNASKSEANAKTSENNSKSSEANAKTSETSASQSASSASNSAKTAKEKADEASQFALECQDIKQSLGTVYTYRGAVASVPDLPTNAKVGDVYDVQDSGTNYAWNGDRWDSLGASIDLSLYATKEYVNTTEQEIIENYMEADTALQTQITSLSTVVDEEQEKIIGIESKIPTSASSSNLLVTNTDMFNATQDVRADFAEADSELQTQINGQATAIANKQDKLTSGTGISIDDGIISANTNIEQKGMYNSSTTYKAGEIVRYYISSSQYQYFISLKNDNKGNSPNDLNNGNWAVLNNLMQLPELTSWGDYPICTIKNNGTQGTTPTTWRITEPNTTTSLANIPTINMDTGVMKAPAGIEGYYKSSEVDEVLTLKQDALVSGTNIKTINGESLLGGGDVEISGGITYEDLNEDVTINPTPIREEWETFRNSIDSIISSYQAQVEALQTELDTTTAELNKVKSVRYPVEKWVGGTEWYTVYSDGWIEQGGYTATNGVVTFKKSFKNTNYTLVGGLIPGTASATFEHLNMGLQTTTGFTYTRYDNYNLKWYACGY